LPQRPQFLTSDCTTVQAIPQRSFPVGQGARHAPRTQARSPPQEVPHRPQWLLSLKIVVHTLPHCWLGGAQPPSTMAKGRHAPSTQALPAAQTFPQRAQWAGSSEVFTQVVPQAV
jgi:hypothetical protein